MTIITTWGRYLACLLAKSGRLVTYVTTEGKAGQWSQYTGEQERTQQQMLELGIEIIVSTTIDGFDGECVTLACTYTGRKRPHAASTLVLVTSREPCDELYRELVGPEGESTDSGSSASAIAGNRPSSFTRSTPVTGPRANWASPSSA